MLKNQSRAIGRSRNPSRQGSKFNSRNNSKQNSKLNSRNTSAQKPPRNKHSSVNRRSEEKANSALNRTYSSLNNTYNFRKLDNSGQKSSSKNRRHQSEHDQIIGEYDYHSKARNRPREEYILEKSSYTDPKTNVGQLTSQKKYKKYQQKQRINYLDET
jgi:hypothetical protein